MITNEFSKARKILAYIGGIDDSILEEAEFADIAAETVARKRYVKYGTLAAAATFGVAVTTYLLLRYRRVGASA